MPVSTVLFRGPNEPRRLVRTSCFAYHVVQPVNCLFNLVLIFFSCRFVFVASAVADFNLFCGQELCFAFAPEVLSTDVSQEEQEAGLLYWEMLVLTRQWFRMYTETYLWTARLIEEFRRLTIACNKAIEVACGAGDVTYLCHAAEHVALWAKLFGSLKLCSVWSLERLNGLYKKIVTKHGVGAGYSILDKVCFDSLHFFVVCRWCSRLFIVHVVCNLIL